MIRKRSNFKLHVQRELLLILIFLICDRTVRAGKIRFSGTQKFVLLKASSGECCATHNFVVLVMIGSIYTCLPYHVPRGVQMK